MTTIVPDTRMSITAELSPAAWDARLAELGGHLFQSWRWGAFKQRHGWRAFRIFEERDSSTAMAQILYRFRGPFSLGYVPRGPAFSGDYSGLWSDILARIDRLSRRQRAISTFIELNEPVDLGLPIDGKSLRIGSGRVLPGRTVKVHLADDDTLLRQMHQKTRYNIRLAERRGVTIARPHAGHDSVECFYSLLKDTAERNAFGIHSSAYYEDFLTIFGDDAVLLFAHQEDGRLAAGLIAARFGREAIYMYGASSSEHRAHGAAFRLQLEAMRWAREAGCHTYDLWGIPERDPESMQGQDSASIAGTRGNDWRGLYRFKTGFGGDIISYPPQLERPHLPLLPRIVRKLHFGAG